MRLLEMNFKKLLFIFLFCPLFVQAQIPDAFKLFSIGEKTMLDYGLSATLDSLHKYKVHFDTTGDFQRKSIYYQALMTFAAFGDYAEALKAEGKAYPRRKSEPSDYIKGTAVNAAHFIREKYKSSPIVLLNEAHGCSQNRAFVRDLLPVFKEEGFNVLALEALYPEDTILNKRRYPVFSSGMYTRDPIFAQLIRDAVSLGFEIVPYDFPIEGDSLQNREIYQATRLNNLIKDGKKALVLAGHDHIHKKGRTERMASFLIKMLGRDVTSIECTVMRERQDTETENPYYQQAIKQFPDMDEPFVVVNEEKAFVTPNQVDVVNFNVFFPRTKIKNGFPHWYFSKGLLDTEVLKKSDKEEFFQIFYLSEWEVEGRNTIPYAQGYLRDYQEVKLSKGNFKFLFSGETVREETIVVK